MPEVSVRTGARILIEVGDGRNSPTAGHPAAYAGLAPRRADVLFAMLRDGTLYEPQPSTSAT